MLGRFCMLHGKPFYLEKAKMIVDFGTNPSKMYVSTHVRDFTLY